MAELAALSLGSNLGDKRGNIAEAVRRLETGATRLLRRSSDYRTPPWGITDQDWFVNACVLVETRLSPDALLDHCLEVERSLGRVRATKWGPRLIDVDVLTYGGLERATERLTLPHPRALERAFVLVPLAEIAPDLVIAGVSVGEAVARLDTSGVHRLDEAGSPRSPDRAARREPGLTR